MRRSLVALGLFFISVNHIHAQRQMEYLDRGVVAVRNAEGSVFISWRLLATDPQDISFNLYRVISKAKPEKLNKAVISETTHFIDAKADSTRLISYFVKTVIKGKEGNASKPFIIEPGNLPYFSISLQTPQGYSPNDGSVGNLEGS